MEGGDISDRLSPRWLFQFEHLIAEPPDVRRFYLGGRMFGRTRRMWRHEINQWVTVPFTVQRMLDLYWRLDARFDLVTFLDVPVEATDAMVEYMSDRSVPVGRCLRYEPDGLARSLAYMPDVTGVVHQLKEAQFKFGSRGWYIPEGEKGWSLQ